MVNNKNLKNRKKTLPRKEIVIDREADPKVVVSLRKESALSPKKRDLDQSLKIGE